MALLTFTEACERVSRRPRTVRYWIARGWLRAVIRDAERRHLYREHDVLVAERRARTGQSIDKS